MSREKTKFVQARRNYNPVKYFPFGNEPGESYVLTSDPWNYLKAFLKNEHDKLKKRTKKNGPIKEKLNKALYFVSLAESFLKSAENVDMPTKGTLTYYYILNLTKAFLLVRDYDLETNTEHHGLSLNSSDTENLTISNNTKGSGIYIFQSFAKELGYTLNPGDKINLNDMVSNLPEIHELTFNLRLLNKTKRKFLPVKIEFISNETRWTKLTYRICYEKKHKNTYRIEKFTTGEIASLLVKNDDIDGQEVFISKQIRNLTHKSDTSWCSNYAELCNEIKKLNVRLMLTRQGYKYYIDLQPDKYDTLIYSYALMFYIGSVARYRPSLNEKILEGDYKAIISETMKSTPKQFLYQITGLITKKSCAIPMANLD
jgi:hypothetical protein